MTAPLVFLTGSDWEGSSGPIITRQADTDDLWPESALLDEGDHPVLAIGTTTSRPNNVVGFVVSYEPNTDLAEVNIAPGFIGKAYVCNITGYSGGVANAWSANLAAFVPVYIDDSTEMGAGCTLSLSPTNSAGAENPLAGYVWPDQTEVDQSGIGGRTASRTFPIAFDSSTDEAWLTVNVMLWPSNQD